MRVVISVILWHRLNPLICYASCMVYSDWCLRENDRIYLSLCSRYRIGNGIISKTTRRIVSLASEQHYQLIVYVEYFRNNAIADYLLQQGFTDSLDAFKREAEVVSI